MEFFAIPALLLVVASVAVILTAYNWRIQIGALAVMYVGAFVLVSQAWPQDLAVIKLVAGWMAGAVLGLSRVGNRALPETEQGWPTERAFRLLAAGLVLIAAISAAGTLQTWVPEMMPVQIWGGLALIGLGLLQLGFSGRTFQVALSLLIMLAGFEILYASLETSTLVAGLLAMVNLSLSLVASYMMPYAASEENEAAA
jgi:hypothetical protein